MGVKLSHSFMVISLDWFVTRNGRKLRLRTSYSNGQVCGEVSSAHRGNFEQLDDKIRSIIREDGKEQ
jgi:hypothetical protein